MDLSPTQKSAAPPSSIDNVATYRGDALWLCWGFSESLQFSQNTCIAWIVTTSESRHAHIVSMNSRGVAANDRGVGRDNLDTSVSILVETFSEGKNLLTMPRTGTESSSQKHMT